MYIWVEGDDDEQFVNNILKPIFADRYDFVSPVQYAQETADYVSRFLRSINQMGADYIFFSDINASNCITQKKAELTRRFQNLDNKKTIIVVIEIESWLLAGLDKNTSDNLKIKCYPSTNDVTKEEFDKVINKNYDSRIVAISEILSNSQLT